MASASSTLRVNPYPFGVDNTQMRQKIYGTCILSPSGTYINTSNASSGIPLNWWTMQDGNFGNQPTFLPTVGPTQISPAYARFFTAGQETTIPGYGYVYNVLANGSSTLRILSGGTELTNTAAITADNISFEAEFIRNL